MAYVLIKASSHCENRPMDPEVFMDLNEFQLMLDKGGYIYISSWSMISPLNTRGKRRM